MMPRICILSVAHCDKVVIVYDAVQHGYSSYCWVSQGKIIGILDLMRQSELASAALGPDQTAVPSENVEEREEEEVPLRRKRSAYRRARTVFSTPAFEQFQAYLSAGPSVAADKGKAPMPDLDIPAEFLAEDAQAEDLVQQDLPKVSEERAKELDDLMLRMTETDWLNLMMQGGSNPALAKELLGAEVNEGNFIERMTA
ncbi:hypothetical protein Tco_1061477 [Tanacetum coccineum]